jgi:hypothetical protein
VWLIFPKENEMIPIKQGGLIGGRARKRKATAGSTHKGTVVEGGECVMDGRWKIYFCDVFAINF